MTSGREKIYLPRFFFPTQSGGTGNSLVERKPVQDSYPDDRGARLSKGLKGEEKHQSSDDRYGNPTSENVTRPTKGFPVRC